MTLANSTGDETHLSETDTSNQIEKLLGLVLELSGFHDHFPLVVLLTDCHRDIPTGPRE